MGNRAKTLELAIIGSGFGFQEILPVLLAIKNVKVFLMKPRDYSSSSYKAYAFPNVSFCSLDEIIGRSLIRLVFIAVPPFIQLEFVKRIAPSGKAIYLEKPGGLNYPEASRIQKIAQEFGNNLYVGFQYRFDPVFMFIKNHLVEHLGQEIKYVNVDWKIQKPSPTDGWKQNLALGGGVYRDHLCHIIDLLRSSFGFSEDSFGVTKESYMKDTNLLDCVHLKSKDLQIRIEREKEIESSLKIVFVTQSQDITIKTKFPFRLGDYSVTCDGLTIPLPITLDLKQDARRFALNSYIQSILDEEYSDHSQSDKHIFPRIEDAMFTQKISDLIWSGA